jgi:hypothetical protein
VKSAAQKLARARRPFGRERPDFIGFRAQQTLAIDEEARAALTVLYELLEQLSVETRLVWLLREVEQLDLWEIANLLGTSKARARRAVVRADHRMRALGASKSVRSLLSSGSRAIPIPFSEFERAKLHRRIEQRLQNREKPRYSAWAAGAIVLSALASFVVVVLHRRLAVASEPPAATSAPEVVELPDGTRATLSAGAELRVNLADPRELELTLRSGTANFTIVPNPNKRFVVNVGAASVAARGRRLSVSIGAEGKGERPLPVQVTTSGGSAELWRRVGAPSILLEPDETWSGSVSLADH